MIYVLIKLVLMANQVNFTKKYNSMILARINKLVKKHVFVKKILILVKY